MIQLASSDGWRPAAAAVTLTRPASWICYDPAVETFLQVIEQVQAYEPSATPGWLAAGCQGLAGVTPTPDVTRRLRELADTTAGRLHADALTHAALLQVADDVAQQNTRQ